MTTRLWDVKHPYYCQEGCFFSNDCHVNADSWAAFKGEFEDSALYNSDEDDNLLFRWDWYEDHDEGTACLELRYFLQRKAMPLSVSISVTRNDEPEIRAWLAKKWQHLQRLWTPFAPDISPDVGP